MKPKLVGKKIEGWKFLFYNFMETLNITKAMNSSVSFDIQFLKLISSRLRGFLFLIFIICEHSFLIAQSNPYNISGSLLDMESKPIEIGNVIVLSKKDSSLVKGTVFMDGNFRINGLIEKEFLLKISSIGLKDTILIIAYNGQDSLMKIGPIRLLNNNTLTEVSIVAKTPLFENDGEKLKVNVENTSLSSSGSVLDILRTTPGIMVSSNDNVSVFGKGAALIYLDGQLITSPDILNAIPSFEIKTIEIIKNPSSKYDAAGRSVINIITKKRSLLGYNGNIYEILRYSKYLISYSGFNINYKTKKYSLNFSYSNRQGKIWSSDNYVRTSKKNDTTINKMTNDIFETRNLKNVHYLKFGYNYVIDSTTSIGLQYIGSYDNKIVNTNNQNEITGNNIFLYLLRTNSNGSPITINQSINTNYSKKFDTLGTEVSGALQYASFDSYNPTSILVASINNITSANTEKRNRNKSKIDIYTLQQDFIKVFSKKWNISGGIKDSYTSNASEIRFDNFYSGEWIPDTSYYNGFSYKENILAAYGESKFKKNKFTMRAGLRGEQTYANGFSKKRNQQIILRNYFNFFPNAYFGYDITKDFATNLTYSRRIQRQSFQDMDPFINYIDSLSSFRGNPSLKPEYTQSIETSLIYMKEASLTFGYSRTKDAINLVVEKLNTTSDAFIASTKNLDKSELFTFGLTIPYQLNWWTTSNYFGYSFNTYSYKSGGIQINNSHQQFSFYFYNEFRFKSLFSLEATYNYNSSNVDGIFITKPISMLSGTLKKTFFHDKLICRFSANDILKSYVMAGKSNVQGYEVSYISRINSNSYIISLNYKFGKLKITNQDKSINTDEINRIKTGK
jgi:outer membrane receptor protein involved in Fe transport